MRFAPLALVFAAVFALAACGASPLPEAGAYLDRDRMRGWVVERVGPADSLIAEMRALADGVGRDVEVTVGVRGDDPAMLVLESGPGYRPGWFILPTDSLDGFERVTEEEYLDALEGWRRYGF